MNRSVAWALVVIQLGLLALVIFAPAGSLWPRTSVMWGAALALILGAGALGVAAGVQLGSNLTPNPIPKEEGKLVVTGIYRWVRHPIYTALLMGAAGAALLGASVIHLVALSSLLILLGIKARVEERLLEARFVSYRGYAGHTGRFVPGIGRNPGMRSGGG